MSHEEATERDVHEGIPGAGGKACDRRRVAGAGSGTAALAAEAGQLGEVGKQHRPLTEVELENARLKRELAEVKMERELLKKAAAYFAKESL